MFKKAIVLTATLLLSVPSYSFISSSENKALLESEKNTINVYKRNVSSVVSVTNIKKIRSRSLFFEMDATEVPAGAGTGFVWNKDGYIVTNFHVIQGGTKFRIAFHGDQKEYPAKLVGSEPLKDIAVLKLTEKPKNLNPISVGASKSLVVGQKVMALGNPFGLDSTITSGIISALGRRIEGIGGVKIKNMIQTDASINPGNSGGPLLDSQGKVVGMNTMIFSGSGSSSGVGFAVPVDAVKRIVPQLIKNGKVERPGLKIGISPENYKIRFGLKKGIIISYVDKNGPAGKAGLQGMKQDQYGRIYLGDVILAIDGKEVNNFDEIYNLFENYKVGDKVKVTYLRDGEKKTASMRLSVTGNID